MSFRDLMTDDVLKANLVIVGIPYDKSASVGKGTALAPDKMRKLATFLPPFTKDGLDLKGFKIYDEGNFYLKKNEKSFEALSLACKQILNFEKFTLFLGGDHATAISTEKAFSETSLKNGRIPVLLHLDAHADICDYYDGSPLSHATPVRRAIDHGIKTENIVMFGIRSYEDQEVDYLTKHPELKVYSAKDINDKVDAIIKDVIARFSDSKYDVHLSFDIDMIDPSFAPGTGTPEHFGVESDKALKLILSLIESLNVSSMDLVEISPKLDVNDITSWLGLKILYEIFYVLKLKLKNQ